MNREKGHIYLYLLLAILILGGLLAVFVLKNNSTSKQKEVFDWEVPDFPEVCDLIESKDFKPYEILLNEPEAVLSPISIPVNGKYYSCEYPFTDPTNMGDGNDFYMKLLAMSETGNWKQTLDLGSYHVAVYGADGPTGSTIGYFRREGYMLRAYIYGYNISKQVDFNPATGESIVSCPCSESIQVFVSDPVDITEYIYRQ